MELLPAMKPYYQSDGLTIYCGENLEIIPCLPTVDFIVADPPYEETNIDWDTVDGVWLDVIADKLSLSGSMWMFGSLRSLMAARDWMMKWQIAQDVIWEKHNGSNSMADRFRRVHEIVLQVYRRDAKWKQVYKDPRYSWDGEKKAIVRRQSPQHWSKIRKSRYVSNHHGRRLIRSVVRFPSTHGHALWPTQKPLGLVKLLALYSCKPGGIILDPYLGSGTSLVVAKELGLRAIGIDKDERACEIAAIRLQQEFIPFQ